MITVLHIVKTSDGARWACAQARELIQKGVEVHVAIPSEEGEAVQEWRQSGAILHIHDLSVPTKAIYMLPKKLKLLRKLVTEIKPDIIHSHFVTNSLLVRLALRWRRQGIIRIFQVPGPLHMEHALFRRVELLLSNKEDRWICASKYIKALYIKYSVEENLLYVSYPSFPKVHSQYDYKLRESINVSKSTWIVGNVSYMYKPKPYLGQKKGLKRHEDIIGAMQNIKPNYPNIDAVFIGGQWGNGTSYEESLRNMSRNAGDAVKFAGRLPPKQAYGAWSEIDCAVHIPESENCGGVIDPLFNGVPVIASDVGGLPEVIIDGETGWLVPLDDELAISKAIEEVYALPVEAKRRAEQGKKLVETMFDIDRTSKEIYEIYTHMLGKRKNRPAEFDSTVFLDIHG